MALQALNHSQYRLVGQVGVLMGTEAAEEVVSWA